MTMTVQCDVIFLASAMKTLGKNGHKKDNEFSMQLQDGEEGAADAC